MTRHALRLLLFAGFSLAVAGTDILVIDSATIIDVRSGSQMEDAVIVMEGGPIKAGRPHKPRDLLPDPRQQ